MLRKTFGVFVIVVGTVTGPIGAEDSVEYVDYDLVHTSSFADTTAEVIGGEDDGCKGCGATYGCNCYCDSGCGGWRAGVDLLIVKPHFDDGVDYFVGGQEFENGVLQETDPPSQQDPDWDFEAAPRFWLAYENSCGRGVRMRYFVFDHASNNIVDTDDDDPGFRADIQGDLNMRALDIDAYQRICLGPADLALGVGFRYGKVDLTRSRGGVENGGADPFYTVSNTDFEGFGPTFAFDAIVPVGVQTSIIGGVRGSLLYGETKMGFANMSEDELQLLRMNEEDDVAYVLEGQFGIERTRCVGNGVVRVNLLVEAQYWGGVVKNGILFPGGFPEQGGGPFQNERNTADNSVGLFGMTIGFVYEQ